MARRPKLISKKLSFRLSLTVIVALATLLVIALLIIFIFSRKAVKEEALQNAGQTLEATMQHIDNILLDVEQSSGNIYWKMLSHTRQPEKVALYARKLVETSPYITDCTITWASDTSATDSVFMGWINPEKTKANTITTFRLPIFEGPRTVGVMDVDVSLALVSRILLPDGTIVVHPDTTALNHNVLDFVKDGDPSMGEAARSMLSGETGYKRVRLDGEAYYVFFKPFKPNEVIGRAMSDLGWSAGVIYPEDDIFGDYNRLLYHALIIAVAGLLLLLLSCRLFIHLQLMPLRKLEKSARRIAEGDYQEPLQNSRRQDEVGRLQNHFCEMQRSLATRMGEMEQLTATLKQRGEELQATYEQAQAAERMKTNFLYNMSDQMIVPVSVIRQSVMTLSDNASGLTEEEINRLVESIQSRGEAVTALLNQLISESEKIMENG